MVVQSTRSGTYYVQLIIDDVVVGKAQSVYIAPGPAQLNRCLIAFEDMASSASHLTAGQDATLRLAASDKFGNAFDLAEAFQVRAGAHPTAYCHTMIDLAHRLCV